MTKTTPPRRRISLGAAITLVSALLGHSTPSADADPGTLRRRRGHGDLQYKSISRVETTYDVLHTDSNPTAEVARNALQNDADRGNTINDESAASHRGGRDMMTKRATQLTTYIEPTPQSYIVGGTQAPKDRYGYYTSVNQQYGSVDYHICGGSLIHDDIVLTAAHCAANAESVRIGAYVHFRHTNAGAPMHETDVIDRIQHPNFFADKYNRLHYDFALLKLKEPVTDPDLLNSIVSLDLSGEHTNRFMSGEPLTAMGLGQLWRMVMWPHTYGRLTFPSCPEISVIKSITAALTAIPCVRILLMVTLAGAIGTSMRVHM